MAYSQPRLNCWFCNTPKSDISLIVSPGKSPDIQFRPFNIDVHERCYQLYLNHGDLQLRKEWSDRYTITS